MEFRPCIDIHNGSVKQIVGSSLKDEGNQATDNFVSTQDGAYYARMYKEAGIKGGHIILLNKSGTEYFEATRNQALLALHEYPGGLQIGGGIDATNAPLYIKEGASHVVVTSYVFSEGRVNYDNLDKLVAAVGKEHLVLDLSCRYRSDIKDAGYYIVTDRWQKYTDERVDIETLDKLSGYCSEFLIHAVDVEGKQSGIEEPLVKLLGDWGRIPITYAGGVGNFSDLEKIHIIGNNKLNVTVGSALSIFGGSMDYDEVIDYCESTKS